MNIEQVHVPHRLDGETLREYHERQKLSKRLATHTPLAHNRGTYFKPGTVSVQKGHPYKAQTPEGVPN